ncbi:histidine--tRNA ligase [Endozoicomonas sp. SM1973]|uniref:Histidine--tRNA ligase n=1 Tax=Spartinivicinus marinus TaxID=2994442 RepID=A0A853ICU9_9GAMM|nr:histidine--tRNA ligase [Spartinivicinus marinus]MCX4025555.1 histidine--tRNA ligase [Spartinivicinus marinus]NYZ65216.1 histidine--tRNA ligase [Spartinivicinus marinus]
MAKKLQAIRGMNDILPAESSSWQYVEQIIRQLQAAYGYHEIRTPIVESTDLFKRSIGEVTDIVEKEMYTFEDRNGDSLTLRPEGTASCVRAAIEHGLIFNQIQRMWYMGPMFRHERPQKGRYRQFHQLGVEAFGMQGPDIDAELIIMTARLWKMLGIDGVVRLEINSLGTTESRARYREALVEYLNQYKDQLDEDSVRRLSSNPLRILDSKDSQTQAILKGAPVLMEFLDETSKVHFDQLLAILDQAKIGYQINPKLVRGLDYYCDTVFEWITDELGAQGTVCAGGRYDGLVTQLGGKPSPAVGFAMGMERLILMLESLNKIPAAAKQQVDAALLGVGDVTGYSLMVAEQIRSALPGLRLQSQCGSNSFKSLMKRADKSGAAVALIIGESEQEQQQVTIKWLREDKPQQTLGFDQLITELKAL